MKTLTSLLTLISVILFTYTDAKTGYFWHITDFHYDPLYSSQGDTRRRRYSDCRRAEQRGSSGHNRALGKYGDYSCDSSIELIESAAHYMRNRHSDSVEFVLWTGDIIASRYTGSEADKHTAIRKMTNLLSRTFSYHFVFPVLGHLDPVPSDTIMSFWMHWLPLEALHTFKIGGYYTIEQTKSNLRIIVLNTNLFSVRESKTVQSENQWGWLDDTLDKAHNKREKVYIVGHAAPGSDTRHAYDVCPDANARYLRTVRKHAGMIVGQFFGHLHADTFRIIYDNDLPVSWAFLAPSVSPHREPSSSSNPGIRLYKFDTQSGKVLDYTQYYLDLAAANRNHGAPEWTAEYNLSQYYGLHEISAISMHNLADRIRIGSLHDATVFNKYLRAYSVNYNSSDTCDDACAYQHFCAITNLEHVLYKQCVDAAASALAAAGQSARLDAPLMTMLHALFMVVLVFV